MKKVLKTKILPQVHAILQRRYGQITVTSGQGVARGERVQFIENGRMVRCVIKTTSGGRISFNWRDGRWGSGLSDTDRVVIAGPTIRHGETLIVSMFDQQTLAEAFEANKAAQRKAGMADEVPSWLAPFHEEGRGIRGVGDGFGDKALWSEPLYAEGQAELIREESPSIQHALEAFLAAARKHPGVSIEVRLKLSPENAGR